MNLFTCEVIYYNASSQYITLIQYEIYIYIYILYMIYIYNIKYTKVYIIRSIYCCVFINQNTYLLYIIYILYIQSSVHLPLLLLKLLFNDDGHHDHHQHADPILEYHQFHSKRNHLGYVRHGRLNQI